MIIEIPYAKGSMQLRLENECVAGVLYPKTHSYKQELLEEELVKKALFDPIESERVSELAKNAGRVLLITSDHTRPVPSRTTLPVFLKEIRRMNPDVEVKILVATGFHRPMTYEEIVEKFGQDIVDHETIINHNSRDEGSMTFKGILPSGGELWLNKLVDWADLVVSEGFIEPHFFAGFSGGRKSILPGIASARTVLSNHCSKFIACNEARTGKLENNPIHMDMIFAARAAKLKFILNVVINSDKKIIRAFTGHPEKAHEEGCRFVSNLAGVGAVEADIVITSNGGYPLDQNIYQAVKGMTAAEACVKPGGVIIMVSACNDGHGGEAFYNWFAKSSGPAEVAEKISGISRKDTLPDQWEAQILARILLKARVIVVTDICDAAMIEKMHMLHAENLEAAVKKAIALTDENAEITVIPDGVGVIVYP